MLDGMLRSMLRQQGIETIILPLTKSRGGLIRLNQRWYCLINSSLPQLDQKILLDRMCGLRLDGIKSCEIVW